MNEKYLLSRIAQKHDIETNWNNSPDFIPMRGELIVYDIDANYDYERLKIGDGATPVTELPFVDENVSWNTLKDKPFGETTVIGEALYWDGNLEGRPTFEDQSSNFFVQVSEATPSLTQLYNGGAMIFYGGEYREFSERDIVGEQTDTIIGIGSHIPFVRIVLEETDGIPKGTYFYYLPGDAELEREPYHVETLVVNGFDQYEGIGIKTIDPKYLPANVATQEYVDEAISSIPAWAKAASKPTYTAAEVGAVTEAQVTTLINNALGVIENGAY